MATSASKRLSTATLAYVLLVSLFAALALIRNFRGWHPDLSLTFWVYLCIAFLCSGMKVLPPGINGNISVNYVFTLLSLLQFQIAETTILAAAGAAAQTFWNARKQPKPIHLVFNVALIVLTVSAASAVYTGAPGIGDLEQAQLCRLVLAGVVYFTVNTLCLSIVIALSEGKSLRTVWQGFYNWLFAYYLVGVSLAEMVHLSIGQLGWAFTIALLPLLYILYRSYRIYFGRLEQEKSHAENVAAMHLRTIETLATAIEAKDECTAEHLRRVQVYSLRLAEQLGLSERDMQALRAASILHDIGKLAVPDYIISKPGKLTPEEFEKMKIHTTVGAAILERVGFPYAVSPIVRSHHEKWDGSGYPDGLKGEKIPLGARILAAVDCLDALASDRQYRRALSLDEALRYVVSRAGTDFDPRVVSVLEANYREFEDETQKTPVRRPALDKDLIIERGEAPDAGFEKNLAPAQHSEHDFISSIASARHEVQTILEMTHDLSGSLRLEDTLSMFGSRLKEIVPFDCIAVYIQDGAILRPRYVSGENSRLFMGLEIPMGGGLSGWVAENRKPIINGNPSVEPGYLDDPKKFSLLHSALSVPIGDGHNFKGALCLYRVEKEAFDRDHLRVLLAVTGQISRAIGTALQYQNAEERANTDSLTELPNGRALFLHLQAEIKRGLEGQHTLAILVCDLDGFKLVNDRHGHLVGNQLLRRVADILRIASRSTDYVARMGGDEFVVLLSNAPASSLGDFVERIDGLINQAGREVCGETGLGMSVGIACFPDHGSDVEALINYADTEMYCVKGARKARAKSSRAYRFAIESRKSAIA